jgi:hypothetical protein
MNARDPDYWEKKQQHIKSNIKASIESRETFLKNTVGIRRNFDQAENQVNNDLEKLSLLREFYNVQGSGIRIDQYYEGSIDSMIRASDRDVRIWNTVTRNWGQLKNQTDSLVATLTASGSMIPSLYSGTHYLITERTDRDSPYYQYANRFNQPSPQDRKEQLVEKLKQIEPYLATRLNGAWQT